MKLLLFTFLLICGKCYGGSMFAPPSFKLTVKDLKIETLTLEYITDMKVNLFDSSEGQLINVTFNLLKQAPTDLALSIQFHTGDNNGHYTKFGKPIKNSICRFIKSDRLFYPGILQFCNLEKQCPFHAGKKECYNYKMPLDSMPPILPTGDMYIMVTVTHTAGTPLAALHFYATVERN